MKYLYSIRKGLPPILFILILNFYNNSVYGGHTSKKHNPEVWKEIDKGLYLAKFNAERLNFKKSIVGNSTITIVNFNSDVRRVLI